MALGSWYWDCMFITPICTGPSWAGFWMNPAAGFPMYPPVPGDCPADVIRYPFNEPYGDIRFVLIATFGLTLLDRFAAAAMCWIWAEEAAAAAFRRAAPATAAAATAFWAIVGIFMLPA